MQTHLKLQIIMYVLFKAGEVMSAFLHHCPFLKSSPGPALRNVGRFLGMADRCPIIARQISIASQNHDEKGV